ncbi:MAG: diaminopimelate epimerase [Acidimicrobiia bacterium]
MGATDRGVMTTLRFYKLHAAANDFLVVVRPHPMPGDVSAAEALEAFEALDAASASALLDRHRGIGGDTLLILNPGSEGAHCQMMQYEHDGSMAEMTGNGIRCLAYVADQLGLTENDQLIVDTPAGRRTVDIVRDPATGVMTYAWVAMGDAIFEPARIPVTGTQVEDLQTEFHDATYIGDAVGIGNPHLVNYVDDVDAVRVTAHGASMEHDPRFPNRANVHWVSVLAPDRIRMRTWERGVGPTLACGTGATAAVAALHRRGRVGTHVVVEVPGGELQVEVGSPMRLGGPVVHVFTVDFDVERLPRLGS